MSDKELRIAFLKEIVKRGLSVHKTSKLINVAYSTMYRALWDETHDLSRLMRVRMEAFIDGEM